MKGSYFIDGTEYPNLITDYGRRRVLEYLAGTSAAWAGTMVIGTGSSAPTVEDTKLYFEFDRATIHLKEPNYTDSSIKLISNFDLTSAGMIHEIGIYAEPLDALFKDNNLIYRFSQDESWLNGSIDLTRYRVGSSSLLVMANASTTKTVTLSRPLFIESQTDNSFSLSYFINDANTNSITIRLHTNTGSYFRYTIDASASAGYYIHDWNQTDFISVGSPDWNNIAYAEIDVQATAGGSTNMNLDSLKIVYNQNNNKLISRSVLTIPKRKDIRKPLIVEYVMSI